MSLVGRLAVIAILVLAPAIGGCAGDRSAGRGPAAMSPEERAALKPQKSDEAIMTAVKEAFANDAEVSKEQIEVTVKDGRVTLVGTVSSTLVMMRAEELARDVPEVFGVDAERLVAR